MLFKEYKMILLWLSGFVVNISSFYFIILDWIIFYVGLLGDLKDEFF